MIKTTHSGWILLAGAEVVVHRLEDGRRVLRVADLATIFGDSDIGPPIEYRYGPGAEVGVEADALVAFCEATVDSALTRFFAGEIQRADTVALQAHRVLRDIRRPPPRPVIH